MRGAGCLNENAVAQNDVTAGTNTGVAASANHQVLAAGKDSFGASGDHATALASIQSSTLDAPTQRVAGLQNLSIRDFDASKRV